MIIGYITYYFTTEYRECPIIRGVRRGGLRKFAEKIERADNQIHVPVCLSTHIILSLKTDTRLAGEIASDNLSH